MSSPTPEIGSGTTWFCDRAPGSNEAAVVLGNLWINTATTEVFILRDATPSAQIWTSLN